MLFVCSGNRARSQMAEGLLRHLAGDRFQVHSAGTDPGVRSAGGRLEGAAASLIALTGAQGSSQAGVGDIAEGVAKHVEPQHH